MSWKPVLVGGKKYDEMTWIQQIDHQVMQGKDADHELIGSLIAPRWPLIRLALETMFNPQQQREA